MGTRDQQLMEWSVPSSAGVDRRGYICSLVWFGILLILKLGFQRAHPKKEPSKRQEAEAARPVKLPRTGMVNTSAIF